MSDRNLWCAVLRQYLEDAQKSMTNQELRQLLNEAMSDYTAEICDWVDIEHKMFLRTLYKTLAKNQKMDYQGIKLRELRRITKGIYEN